MIAASHLRHQTQAGFTLLEMLVVLGIAALVVSLATARLQSGAGSSLSLEAMARVMAQQMRVVRSTAIRQHKEHSYQIDFEARGVSASTGLREALPANVSLANLAADGRSRLRIVFFPDGSSSGGAFAIQRNNDRAIVTVDWLTGQPSFRVPR